MELLSPTKEAKVLDAKRFIAEEVNLSRLPFFASSTKGLKKKTSIEYRHTAEIRGREVEVLWRVTANAFHGYPGPLAEAVHAAIMQIVTERGFPVQNPVTFTFYDICKRLELEPSGRTRRQIRSAILSIRFAGIEIQGSFAKKDGRRPSFTDTPNLYSRVIFYGDQDPETGEPIDYSAVWLADFYVNSLNSGYIRPLDFQYFKQLRKASYATFDAATKTTPTSEIAAELTALGVTEQRALRIAKRYTAEQINLQLDHLAYLGEIGRPPAENVGGWLSDAIEKSYTPPKGFKTREERETQRKAQAEADAQRQRAEEQEQQASQERLAYYTRLDTKLTRLPDIDQQRIAHEIETRMRANFDNFMRRVYATKPFDPKSPMHRSEYYQHLADLLQEHEHTQSP